MSDKFLDMKIAMILWCRTIHGDRIAVWLDQNAPRPLGEYVGLKLITGPTRSGHDERIATGTTGNMLHKGQRSLVLSVNVYRGDAVSDASDLMDSLATEGVRDIFRDVKLSIITDSGVRDLATLLDTKFEPRAQFDVTFAYASDLTENTGYIETVELENEIENNP